MKSRAFRSGLDEERGLDLHELVVVHVGVDDLVDPMTQLEDALHPGPAQVQIAVLETQRFIGLDLVVDLERRRLRDRDHLEL
jgi:hypothetical protein